MAGVSGFCRLRSVHGPGSSDAIGACAPFTVWAVVPFSRGGCIIIIIIKILTKTIGIQPVGLDPCITACSSSYYTSYQESGTTAQTVNGADMPIA